MKEVLKGSCSDVLLLGRLITRQEGKGGAEGISDRARQTPRNGAEKVGEDYYSERVWVVWVVRNVLRR